MSTIKTYFTIACYSFTFLMLIYSALNVIGYFPPAKAEEVFIFFLMTLAASALIAWTDRLPIRSMLLASFIRIADVAVCVFGIGLVTEMFIPKWTNVLSILGMIIVIYFGVHGVLMMKDKADENAINKRLSRRNREAGGDEHERNH